MVEQKTMIQDKINKYISKLERNLKNLPKEEILDITSEIKSHIFDSISSYEYDQEYRLDEVLEKLGKPEDYAKMLVEEHIGQVIDKGDFKDNFKSFILQMKLPFLISSLILTSLMMANTAYLYFFSGSFGFIDIIQILFLTIPAILVIIIPMAVLYAVPSAFYTMVKSSKDNKVLTSSKLWSMIMLTGIVSALLSFAINESIVPAANHKTVLVMKQVLTENEKGNVIFSDQKSVQEMSAGEAKKAIEKRSNEGIISQAAINKMKFDYYAKFSIPLSCIAFALFGAFIGCLMLSELFNNTYLMFTCGWLLPVTMWYTSYSYSDHNFGDNPLFFSSFLPDLLITGFSLVMLLGVLLKRDPKIYH